MKNIYNSDEVYVSKSKIIPSERGVFARANIKKGRIIEVCPLIIVPKADVSNLNESILVTYFFYFGKKKEKMALVLGFGSLYNHSYKPNAQYKIMEKEDVILFTATRDIKKNEEITFNYSFGNPKNKNPLWFEIE